jgi:hypothetical protein
MRQEKGGWRRAKRHCDSDANDDEEEQQEEAISYTNTPSFAAREHASRLHKKHHFSMRNILIPCHLSFFFSIFFILKLQLYLKLSTSYFYLLGTSNKYRRDDCGRAL